MYRLAHEDWMKYRGCLLREYIDAEDEEERKRTTLFVNQYFERFVATGGKTEDHFELEGMQRDQFGIPQDMSKRYFVPIERDFAGFSHNISHVPPWLVAHFRYVLVLAEDFGNRQKLKKLQDLRKAQRDLPIFQEKARIVAAVKENPVLIVAGDTGCGKSTQLPQYLLEAGFSKVACTQPRRIACTALAKRVAYETLNVYGSEVAYQIRFESTKTKRTRLLFLTEGLLLRQMEGDPLLQNYDVIILDEVHERHLSSDLLVGLLKQLVESRTDLKLILMSATINLDLFKAYFEGAPVISVPGRLFPIELKYRPIVDQAAEDPDTKKKDHKINPEPFLQVLELIDKEVPTTERGDALIFLNGVAEIETVAETLKTYAELTKGWIVLLLHSTLSVEDQDRVFDVAPQGVRKVILATNIAETSVTIDGIRFVIDSGKVNHVTYDPETRMQRLAQFWVSRAAADQRKGRAGRTGPGICYRLYSRAQYDAMQPFTVAEMQRVSLQHLCLQMLAMNLGLDPRTFEFIEPPSTEAMDEAIEALRSQGIVHPDRPNQLTALGHKAARLPVEVPIARMLVLGCVLGMSEQMLTIAAGLSVQSPIAGRNANRDLDTVKRREPMANPLGDPFTLLNIFREWVLIRARGESTRKWTREMGVDEHRLYEIAKLRNQYRAILQQDGMLPKPTDEEEGLADSRERRIVRGEQRKLHQVKRDARLKERSRKVLRADRHYDTVGNEEDGGEDGDENAERKRDPLAVDVRAIEFSLEHRDRHVDKILRSHKISRLEADVLVLGVALGVYPQLALWDAANRYKYGQEIFVHTRLKPFAQLHPNSSLAQYHIETLATDEDGVGMSAHHRLAAYGLLLETTKPYVVNVAVFPILLAYLICKKVQVKEDEERAILTATLDDFFEMDFRLADEGKHVLQEAMDLRRRIARATQRRLASRDPDDFEALEAEAKKLRADVERYAAMSQHAGIKVKLRRIAKPPRLLENVGFHMPEGRVNVDLDEEDEDESAEAGTSKEQEPEDDPDTEDTSSAPVPHFGSLSKIERATRDAENEAADSENAARKREEEKKRLEKKETYLEKLRRLKREREEEEEKRQGKSAGQEQLPEQEQVPEKRPKVEVVEEEEGNT